MKTITTFVLNHKDTELSTSDIQYTKLCLKKKTITQLIEHPQNAFSFRRTYYLRTNTRRRWNVRHTSAEKAKPTIKDQFKSRGCGNSTAIDGIVFTTINEDAYQ